jgi:hypothetical protein
MTGWCAAKSRGQSKGTAGQEKLIPALQAYLNRGRLQIIFR